MIQIRDIVATLPLVASILGNKYGIEVKIGGKSAYTDGKTVILPSFPLDGDQNLLAKARGFIDHEAAHIRQTDFGFAALQNLTPIQRNLWNIIEDWRVERDLSKLFPGCRKNFNWLSTHLFAETQIDEKGRKQPGMLILGYLVRAVRAWENKALDNARDIYAEMVKEKYPALLPELEKVLIRVRSDCSSTSEAIAYALELEKLIRKELERLKNEEESLQKKHRLEGKHNTMETDCEKTADGHSQEIMALENLLNANEKDLPQNFGESLAAELSLHAPKNMKKGLMVAEEGHRAFSPLSEKELKDSQHTVTALRMRLQSFLQTQAYVPCCSGRRGSLKPSLLHRMAVNNPKLFGTKGKRVKRDTAVHILLDASGSMNGVTMAQASQSCYALSTALAKIPGINVGITVFPGTPVKDSKRPTIASLVRHGERVHRNFGLSAKGRTPLAPALLWVLGQMWAMRENRKIILILTDGRPDSVPESLHAIAIAKKFGVEVYGIGINGYSLGKLLPNSHQTINHLSELAPAMFALLHEALLSPKKNLGR